MPTKSKKLAKARTGKMVEHDGIRSAVSALSQRDVARSSHNGKSSPRRAESSADDLALRAWKTTYKNRRATIG